MPIRGIIIFETTLGSPKIFSNTLAKKASKPKNPTKKMQTIIVKMVSITNLVLLIFFSLVRTYPSHSSIITNTAISIISHEVIPSKPPSY